MTAPGPDVGSGDRPAPGGDGLLFLVGGARSGKSDFAVRAATALGARQGRTVAVVATGVAFDVEMSDRIERHQADRPSSWAVVEVAIEVEAAVAGIDGAEPTAPILIVDCLTTWTANLMVEGWDDGRIEQAGRRLAGALAGRVAPTIVVGNEVGLGIVPDNDLGRRYRDVLGRLNQSMAAAADRTLFLAAGRAVELRPPDEILDLGPDPGRPAG